MDAERREALDRAAELADKTVVRSDQAWRSELAPETTGKLDLTAETDRLIVEGYTRAPQTDDELAWPRAAAAAADADPARLALAIFMDAMSEEHFAADWYVDLEHALVRQLTGEELAAYRWLVQGAGGYWTFDETAPDPSYRRFVPGSFEQLEREARQ